MPLLSRAEIDLARSQAEYLPPSTIHPTLPEPQPITRVDDARWIALYRRFLAITSHGRPLTPAQIIDGERLLRNLNERVNGSVARGRSRIAA